ncbi:MAG TPA: chemotaxis protein CheW [Kofleriaceae bacterium]|nr:chemotaxis protein CheW [Kofleriaceae bacterium]
MKNVIVFALGQARYAIELRWVREVFTLGPVTPVAYAPEAIAGVVNYRGAIMPILDLAFLLGGPPGGARAHGGEGAILIEVEDVRAAVRVSSVVEVSTLRPDLAAGRPALVDSDGRTVPLIDPPSLLAGARSAAQAAAQTGTGEPGDPRA